MVGFADVIVVGAGIVGSLVARELSKFQMRVIVIDCADELCMGASGANSATIHSGHSIPSGTLKNRFGIRGAKMWPRLASALDVPFFSVGDYVIALSPEDEVALHSLCHRASQDGIQIELLTRAELRERVPDISAEAVAAMWCPDSAICDPYVATTAAMENAIENGVSLYLSTKFEDFMKIGPTIDGIVTNRGVWKCNWIVNAAGVNSDQIMHRAGIGPEFRIHPRRGDYFLLCQSRCPVRAQLAPVPSPVSKGIAIKVTVDGYVLVGAQADLEADRSVSEVTRSGLEKVWSGAQRLVPALTCSSAIACLTGLRASGFWENDCAPSGHSSDFVVGYDDREPRLINLAGIDSPGLTAAPALAEEVINLLKKLGLELREKNAWHERLTQAGRTSVQSRVARAKSRRRQRVPDWFTSPPREVAGGTHGQEL